MFPALYSCENWHLHSIGHGQWLEGLGLRLLCAQRAQSRAQRALRALLPCFLLYTAVKIGINIQLDVANGWSGFAGGYYEFAVYELKVVARIVGGG